MIEIVDDLADLLFQHLEIDTHAQVIELLGPHRHPDLPVVTVGLFTVAGVVTQVMPPGKMGFDEDIHERLLFRLCPGKGRCRRAESTVLVIDPAGWQRKQESPCILARENGKH